MRRIDRYCARHPGFGIPNLMIYIVIGNILVLIFSLMDITNTLSSLLLFNPAAILSGQVWRLVTFIFVPQRGNILLTAISLYFYYFIGSTLERQWGPGKFTIYYLLGMLFNIIYGLAVYLLTRANFHVSAMYINLSMFFAFATFYPEQRVLFMFFIPIKIKWLAILNGAFFLYAMIINPFPLNLLPLVAIMNFLLFCGGQLLDNLRPLVHRRSRTTLNFKRAAKKASREAKNQPYTRKCAVCGRTDADYPQLSFRYCSRCEGYRCFCEDHINNHVHFRE